MRQRISPPWLTTSVGPSPGAACAAIEASVAAACVATSASDSEPAGHRLAAKVAGPGGLDLARGQARPRSDVTLDEAIVGGDGQPEAGADDRRRLAGSRMMASPRSCRGGGAVQRGQRLGQSGRAGSKTPNRTSRRSTRIAAGSARWPRRSPRSTVPPGGTIWSSPSSRASETATIIGARFGLAVAADDRLVERDVGPWQGLTASEIESDWPGHLAARRWPAGSESLADVAARAAAALASIAARGGTRRRPHAGGEPWRADPLPHPVRSDRDAVVPNLGGTWFTVTPPDGLVEVGDLFGARAVEPDDDAAPARL